MIRADNDNTPCLESFLLMSSPLSFDPRPIILTMKSYLALYPLAALIAFTQVSCVVGTREIAIDVPQGSRPGGRGAATIARVSDSRQFQNNPGDPSTPSVDGDVSSMSAAERSRYVGRQRNTYGKGMGDITLGGSATVPEKAKEIVAEALAREGYQVGSGGSAVSVDVKKFWAWMTPGMWAISLEARIETVVSVGGKSVRAEGYGKNLCQTATSGNWEEAYRLAVEDLISKIQAKL
jgi:hypothetical protein